MKHEVFIDTSGFFALLVKADDRHRQAAILMEQAAKERWRFLTTDYVLDETATLLKMRGQGALLAAWFDSVLSSKSCRIVWCESELFMRTKTFMLKHADQEWSFTDCLSFCVMKDQRVNDAFTKDRHFAQAGFVALLG